MSPGAAVGFDPSLISDQLYQEWTEVIRGITTETDNSLCLVY